MNTNINKLLATVAVVMMVTTAFGVIASDSTDGTGGGVASSNKDPFEATPVIINRDWTEYREVWEGYPNVTFDIIDGVKTVTFNNANIEFDISGERCISFSGSDFSVIFHGNNEIHLKLGASATSSVLFNNSSTSGKVVTLCGGSMRDTLTIAVQSNIDPASTNDVNAICIGFGNWAIKDCTINFVLEKELDDKDCNRQIKGFYGAKLDLIGCRLLFSINDDVNKQYDFQCIFVDAASTFSDSVIRMRASDKIINESFILSTSTSVVIDCCKLEAEMTQGKVFLNKNGSGAVTFDDFNQIDFYDTLAGEPRIIPGGESYSLTGTDWDVVKIFVDSNVKEPVDDDDNTVVVVVAVTLTVVIAFLAMLVVLFRNRDTI